MGVLGNSTSAAMFETHAEAEMAWDALTEANIPATVITDPGLLGEYNVSVEVDRNDLDRAISVLQSLFSNKRQPGGAGT